jgi:Zn-dependent protease
MGATLANAVDAAFTQRIDTFRPRPEPSPLTPARATTRRSNRFSFSLLLIAVALGAAIELFGPTWAQAVFQTVQLNNAGGISALFAALALSVVLHEGGHLLAAILMDFEVLAICLGPVRATRSYGKWNIAASGKLFTGSISAVPRSTNRWRERALTVVAAGPLMTLVTGLVAGAVLFYTSSGAWTKTFLGTLVELSCFLFVLGLIPNGRTAKVRNDARLFWIFWKDGWDAQEVFLYHLITLREIAGVRPREYPMGLIHAMACAQGRPDSMLVYALTITSWALDCGDIETAKAWDQRALELSTASNKMVQEATLARSACLDVLFRDDLDAAKRKLSGVDLEALAPACFRHRTKAIHALLESNIAEALEEISRARHSFPKRLPCFEFERMLLTRLHRKALALEPQDIATCHTNRAA